MNSNCNDSTSSRKDPNAGPEPPLVLLTTSCSRIGGDLPESQPVRCQRWTKLRWYSMEQHDESFSCPLHQAGIRKRLSGIPRRIFLRDVTFSPYEGICSITLTVLFVLTLLNVGYAIFLGHLWYNQ